jgi:beta-lactam-binding protein with PASTA domain
MDLDLARYKANAAGFTRIDWEDATGRHRRPIEYRNWVVVDQTPAAGTAASSRTQVLFRVLAYGDRGAPPVPDRSHPGRIPKLACFNLREADATLESAGFTHFASEDASGRGRHPIIHRNWTVTGQTPPPGGTYTKSTSITLRVVKQSERSACPSR